MKPKNVILSLLFVLVVLSYAIFRRWQEPKRKEPFGRQPSHLVFTAYALCRMNCFDLSREDVILVMRKGVILINRSNRNNQPCPMYTLQGRTAAGRYIRVLFEQCQGSTRVVGCYDIHGEKGCDCPVF